MTYACNSSSSDVFYQSRALDLGHEVASLACSGLELDPSSENAVEERGLGLMDNDDDMIFDTKINDYYFDEMIYDDICLL